MEKVPRTGFENPEQKTLEEIERDLLEKLPELARDVMEDRPENNNFRENPDDVEEHDPQWHQFGIITHTQEFSRVYKNECQEMLRDWGVGESVNDKLSEEIDGRTKAELLQISIPLHDLGKFARGFVGEDDQLEPDYAGHEAKSERLIMENEKVQSLLREGYGLTDDQIEYVARCAGLHYELGKMRDEAKQSALGYSLAFTENDECREVCGKITDRYPQFKGEIGILFLGDSLAKTDLRIDADSDEDIERQIEQITRTVGERGLNPKLIATVLQRPVNVAVAKVYLEEVKKNSNTQCLNFYL